MDSLGHTVVLTTTHPVAQCVDLRATFKGHFRFTWDPAYAAERPDFRTVEAPWLTRIPCRAGFICPWGGRRLAAYSRSRRRALQALPGVTVVQGGALGGQLCPEVIVTFDVSLIEAVAELLGARRPRVLSPEQREQFIARGTAFRYAARNDDRQSDQGTPRVQQPERDD